MGGGGGARRPPRKPFHLLMLRSEPGLTFSRFVLTQRDPRSFEIFFAGKLKIRVVGGFFACLCLRALAQAAPALLFLKARGGARRAAGAKGAVPRSRIKKEKKREESLAHLGFDEGRAGGTSGDEGVGGE